MTSLRSVSNSVFGKTKFILTELNDPNVVFQADAILTENYNKTASVSSYPVEQGTNISDNSRLNNFTISISGISSDSSMSYLDTFSSISNSAIGGIIGGAFDVVAKSQEIYNQLNNWVDNGTSLVVASKFAESGYTDQQGAPLPFVIESLNIPRAADTGDAVKYTINLKAVRQVTVGEATAELTPTKQNGQQDLKSNTKSNEALNSTNAKQKDLTSAQKKAIVNQYYQGNVTYNPT